METENKEVVLISKGYEFLRQLCSFNANFNAFTVNSNPITNRVEYIMHQLDAHKIPYEIEMFKAVKGVPDATAEDTTNCFVNIVVNFEGIDTTQTTVFLAHHDVANIKSENCQDNTASVANLLDLCVRLSHNKPKNNVVVAFVDAEEIVNPSICGSQKLARNIKSGKYGNVKYAVNLELTANGQNYWMSHNNRENKLAKTIKEIYPKINKVFTPYNDAFVLERENVESVCVGSVDDKNLEQITKSGYCSTWGQCHRMTDTFDTQANEGDMDLFVNWLETLI